MSLNFAIILVSTLPPHVSCWGREETKALFPMCYRVPVQVNNMRKWAVPPALLLLNILAFIPQHSHHLKANADKASTANENASPPKEEEGIGGAIPGALSMAARSNWIKKKKNTFNLRSWDKNDWGRSLRKNKWGQFVLRRRKGRVSSSSRNNLWGVQNIQVWTKVDCRVLTTRYNLFPWCHAFPAIQFQVLVGMLIVKPQNIWHKTHQASSG